jgi:putative monooxygenase
MRDEAVLQPPCAKVALADAPVNRRRGGELRVVLGPKTAGATSGFMGTLSLRPGEYVNEHRHPYSEEFLYVVRGELVLRLDGVHEVTLRPNEGLVVPIDVRHRAENRGTQDVFAIFHLGPLAPRPELGHVDTEPAPNPAEPQLSVGDK